MPEQKKDTKSKKRTVKKWDNETPTKEYFNELKRVSKNQIIWGFQYFMEEMSNSNSIIIWDKMNGKNFMNDCELAWTNYGKAVRRKEHLWNGMIRKDHEARFHPTQKPIALVEWVFEYYKDVVTVLDLFGGSGSTLMAAEKRNKQSFLMELSPAYCDVIIKRWQDFTGQQAVHAETEETFNAPR